MPEPLPTICGQCGKPLGGSASLYFCDSVCQQLWATGQADHEEPTASLAYQPVTPVAAYYMGLAMQSQARGATTPPREDAA